MRNSYASLTIVPGVGKSRTVRTAASETWTTEQAIDNDVDSFSIDIGDVAGDLLDMADRDTEIRVRIYCDDKTGKVRNVFTGLTDIEGFATQKTHTLQGGDQPSSILTATDSEPGYWRHKNPKQLLVARCKALGLTNVRIAEMKEIARLWADGSEKEWSFQYRVAQMGGCFCWSEDDGTFVIDVLNYSPTAFSYSIGDPLRGTSPAGWIKVSDVSIVSNKQQRIEQVRVYGEDKKKKGVIPLATATNPQTTSIDHWLRKPIAISTLSTGRTQKDLDTEAKLQMFESIVGAQEYTISVGDDVFIQQNKMARVNLPEYGIVGNYYIVGVARALSTDGLVQQIRLREREYALDTRAPTAPSLGTQPNTAPGVSTANIAQSIEASGARWSNSFVRAARTYLVNPQGWDFSYALGVLLSICKQESGFRNVREKDTQDEWFPMPTSIDPIRQKSFPLNEPPAAFDALQRILSQSQSLAQAQQTWREMWANSKSNSLNPFYPSREAGVGPMQLTNTGSKEYADSLGWQGSPPTGTPEYAGGRWNPDSNIQASAKLLADSLKQMGADPTNPETIWVGVAAYNAGVAGAKAGGGKNYALAVKSFYDTTYGPAATKAVTTTQKTPAGSALRSFKDGNGVTVASLPDNAPDTVAKAVTWIWGKRGSAYQYGGAGNPGYDCSSLCTSALVIGDPRLSSVISAPATNGGAHGDDTFALRDKGTPVAKNQLLPGDLVFFDGEAKPGIYIPWGHVGMFIGNGIFVADPHTGAVVSYYALGDDYWVQHYNGARRFLSWPGARN